MRIALIGPGIMPIPPKGWGAVEILVWNLAEAVRALGHTVDIYNEPNITDVCKKINDIEYDFIHLQYDNHTEICNTLLKQKYCVTSHYGWLTRLEAWDGGYRKIHHDILSAPGIIALSDQISQLYSQHGYSRFKKVLRNGSEVSKFRFVDRGNGKALCLGKIEPRKSQNFLVKHLGYNGPLIDFVGPKAEPFDVKDPYAYLGEWSKEELYHNLTEYSALILLSAGEAAPLVVPEALAAGLSVIVSPWAAANLPESKYITVIDTQEKVIRLKEYIDGAVALNNGYRHEIRKFAQEYFDWNVIAKDYIRIIEEWKEYCSSLLAPASTAN